MSRIDDLIRDLCPNGVEFKTLGEVFRMKAGVSIRATEMSDAKTDEFQFARYGGNGQRGFTRTASHSGLHLLIGRQGALCGNVKRVTGQFYATEHAVVVTPSAEVDLNWAFHLLTKMNLNQYATKSAQPGLAVSNLERVTMPLPPVEVQREIVRILDMFHSLEARRRQYAYYRDRLLTFSEKGVAA